MDHDGPPPPNKQSSFQKGVKGWVFQIDSTGIFQASGMAGAYKGRKMAKKTLRKLESSGAADRKVVPCQAKAKGQVPVIYITFV